jgi:LuxR family maltose regulon positive regulatory protein
MTLSVLATKLYQPKPRANWVYREQLLNKLNQGDARKFTLVSAPAGFGKTTLVSSWLAEQHDRVAWLSLDEQDNEPRRFVLHLVASLQKVLHALADELRGTLESPTFSLSSHDSFLTPLVNQLARAEAPLFLVLDDYHLIDNSEIDAALAFLLDHQPPQVQLVMTTREDPQLPLPRLRVRGELTEIRISDLKFSGAEIAEFLSTLTGLNLSEQDVAVLEARTEGWAAGLQLAALSLQGLDDPTGFIEAFAGDHHFVLDYLAEEVLHNLPEHERLFLLQTSILERLSAPLCNAVTTQTDADDLLESLERRNLFLIPLDNTRAWFRYHHLFADVLKARLLKEATLELTELHARASRWFKHAGLTADAIHHAFEAGNMSEAAALIESIWRAMDRTFQLETWFAWAQRLPEATIKRHPVLSVGYAWVLLQQGQFDLFEAKLKDAEAHLDGQQDSIVVDEAEFAALPVSIASARAYKAQALGDASATIKHVGDALEHLAEDDHLGRAIPLALASLAYWANGDLDAAFKALSEAMQGFKQTGNLEAALSGCFGLADIRKTQGRLHEAIRVYQDGCQLALGKEITIRQGLAVMHLGLSDLYLEQGKQQDAEAQFLKSEALFEQDAQVVYRYRRFIFLAKEKEAQQSFDVALNLLAEAAQLESQIHIPLFQPVHALQAQVWIKQGKLVKAQAWQKEQNLSVDDELDMLLEFQHITLARLLLAQYQQTQRAFSQLEAFLVRLLEAARAGQRTDSVIRILILQALAYQANGNLKTALECLQQALDLAEPERYVRVFTQEGDAMSVLLAHLQSDWQSDYAETLLRAYQTQDKSTLQAALAQDLLLEPLTARELEVLTLLAEGLSNKDVSKRLHRALDTIKGYNRNIFSKLQVQDRHEAVTKARELGLLSLNG